MRMRMRMRIRIRMPPLSSSSLPPKLRTVTATITKTVVGSEHNLTL